MAIWYEVWIAGNDVTVFDSLDEAREYMRDRGYTQYEGSYPCDHPSEEREYYVREGEDIDEDYADGYAPCITPEGEDDDDDEDVDECDDDEEEEDEEDEEEVQQQYYYAIAREITYGVYDIISRHRNLEEAKRAHRRRNPWVYNDNWAQQHGMRGCGTFEHIYDLDEEGKIV